MLKFSLSLVLVAGAFAATPSLADTNGGGTIGRGCTLNPFDHTMRCIDFDHCTTDKSGNKTCPTTTTSTRKAADNKTTGGKTGGGKGGKSSEYLVVTMDQVLVSG